MDICFVFRMSNYFGTYDQIENASLREFIVPL